MEMAMTHKFGRPIIFNSCLTLLVLISVVGSVALAQEKTTPDRSNEIGYRIDWTTKALMPTPRWNVGVALGTNGKIYVLGGTDGSTHTLATLEEYDPLTNTWSARANMPNPYQGVSAVAADNGKIYAFGGSLYIEEEWGYFSDVDEYDPLTDSWTSKANMPHPRAYAAAVKGSNGKIYIFGGIARTYGCGQIDCQIDVEQVDEYDPINDTWASKASMPTPRHLAAAALGPDGKIYVFGGEQASLYGSLRSVEEYAPSTDTWQSRPDLPAPRSGLAAVAASTVEEYDPSTDTWQSKADLPTPRSGLAAVAASNGRIYAIGGKTNNTTGIVEEFDPLTNGWIKREAMITPRWLFGAAIAREDRIYAIGGNGDCCTAMPRGNNEEGQVVSFEFFPIYLPIAFNNVQDCTAPPTLISPANGSNLATIAPLFVFDGGYNNTATHLRLVVATDPGFTNIVSTYSVGGGGGVGHFRDTWNFRPSTTYYWRTFFICGDVQGRYSETWSFITGSGGTILPAPNLIAPANGSSVDNTPVTLEWSAVPGAVEYLVHWRRLGQSWSYYQWVNNTWLTIYGVSTGNSYEWWVSARNDYAIGRESVKWQFIVPTRSLSSPRLNYNFELEDGSTHQIIETGIK
jgi:N-acetylneuraminic acid mutarotase